MSHYLFYFFFLLFVFHGLEYGVSVSCCLSTIFIDCDVYTNVQWLFCVICEMLKRLDVELNLLSNIERMEFIIIQLFSRNY